MGKVRIIGGYHSSRILTFKNNVSGLRPTLDCVRETLFNWLKQDLTAKNCLDLFAGSGALGFEAASRNAKQVIMVESNLQAVTDLRANKKLLKLDNVQIVKADALAYLKTCATQFDVIFLDPPYSGTLLQQSLNLLRELDCISPHGIIYIEYQIQPDLTGYNTLKANSAGAVNYMLVGKKT